MNVDTSSYRGCQSVFCPVSVTVAQITRDHHNYCKLHFLPSPRPRTRWIECTNHVVSLFSSVIRQTQLPFLDPNPSPYFQIECRVVELLYPR